jgi:hypothetical protein
MKVFIVGLGLILVAIAPASAQWGVQTWGYSTIPSWGATPGYVPGGVYSPRYGGGGCWQIPNPWERDRCRQHRAWQRGW